MQNYKKKLTTKISLSLILLFVIVILALNIGTVKVDYLGVVNILFHKIFNVGLSDNVKPSDVVIIWTLRMPRILVAMFVGACLAVSGSVIQSILKNPLASPYTLGMSSGAGLLVGIFIVFDITFNLGIISSLTIAGFLGGSLTILAIISLSKSIDKKLSNFTIILVGMIMSLFLSSMTTMAASLVSDEKYRQIVSWQTGSFIGANMSDLYTLIPFAIIGFIGLMMLRKELDVLSFGEEEALSMGVNVPKIKLITIILAMLLAGAAISVSGVIGFVGLAVPHIVRKIFGARHNIVIPMSAVFGAMFMVFSDMIARSIMPPQELPVGAVTAFMGAPFFIFVFFGRRNKNA